MVNTLKLKGKIVENGMSLEEFSERCGISRTTFYRKLCEKGKNFTIEEVLSMIGVLSLTQEDALSIFLPVYSQ